jgi:hypothetical protein
MYNLLKLQRECDQLTQDIAAGNSPFAILMERIERLKHPATLGKRK